MKYFFRKQERALNFSETFQIFFGPVFNGILKEFRIEYVLAKMPRVETGAGLLR